MGWRFLIWPVNYEWQSQCPCVIGCNEAIHDQTEQKNNLITDNLSQWNKYAVYSSTKYLRDKSFTVFVIYSSLSTNNVFWKLSVEQYNIIQVMVMTMKLFLWMVLKPYNCKSFVFWIFCATYIVVDLWQFATHNTNLILCTNYHFTIE